VRDYTSEGATRLLEALHRCREAVGDHEPLSLILGTMLDTDAGLAEEFSEREDTLDPAIPLVWFQGCSWTVHLGEPSCSHTTTQRPSSAGRTTWG
jgi:hypothetical protein